MIEKNRTTAALVACFTLLSACSAGDSTTAFRVQCNCSIVHLTTDPGTYSGNRVRVIGVLIPAEHMSGFGRLYLSKDDARFVNDANSIWIDTNQTDNTELPALDTITGQFVLVEGTFVSKGELQVIELVHDIRVLAPLPLDNARFAPGINPPPKTEK